MYIHSTVAALSAAMAVGFAACGQPAAAQDTEAASAVVSYKDLDLAGEAGAKVMLQRIRVAAEKVCAIESDDPLDRLYEWAPCVKSTTARAVAKLQSPMVTALFGGAPARTALASNR